MRALEVARRRWPQYSDRPSRLLKELITAGAEAVDDAADSDVEARLSAVLRAAGGLSSSFPDGYLDELRSEWPE